MDLDRGTLAKIDRRVLSGLAHEESYQMVRVPVSVAVWSTWKRYCDALGISMGRAIVALVENELKSAVGEADALPMFREEVESGLSEGKRTLDARELGVKERERRVKESEKRIWAIRASPPKPSAAKVGRNDPCPCTSGLKYKRCHGGALARVGER